jgi:hypothetical protein
MVGRRKRCPIVRSFREFLGLRSFKTTWSRLHLWRDLVSMKNHLDESTTFAYYVIITFWEGIFKIYCTIRNIPYHTIPYVWSIYGMSVMVPKHNMTWYVHNNIYGMICKTHVSEITTHKQIILPCKTRPKFLTSKGCAYICRKWCDGLQELSEVTGLSK